MMSGRRGDYERMQGSYGTDNSSGITNDRGRNCFGQCRHLTNLLIVLIVVLLALMSVSLFFAVDNAHNLKKQPDTIIVSREKAMK